MNDIELLQTKMTVGHGGQLPVVRIGGSIQDYQNARRVLLLHQVVHLDPESALTRLFDVSKRQKFEISMTIIKIISIFGQLVTCLQRFLQRARTRRR
jgi:hypothetical protein